MPTSTHPVLGVRFNMPVKKRIYNFLPKNYDYFFPIIIGLLILSVFAYILTYNLSNDPFYFISEMFITFIITATLFIIIAPIKVRKDRNNIKRLILFNKKQNENRKFLNNNNTIDITEKEK